jgi:hypothetical protein
MATMFRSWELAFCAAYLVPPCRGLTAAEAMATLLGSPVDVATLPGEYFGPLFCEQAEKHPIGVAFAPEDGVQKNSVRDLVRTLAFGDTAVRHVAAEDLTVRLALATDKRSVLSLFLVLVGAAPDGRTRVVFWTFPANPSLRASMGQQGMSIELIRDAFSRSGSFYKAAMFEGPQVGTSFWQGAVEDRQAKSRARGVSDFWIVSFLSARLAMTGAQGTRLIAKTIRQLASQNPDADSIQALVDAAMTLLSQPGELVSLRQVADSYLPPGIRVEFLSSVGGEPIVDMQFRLESETLRKELRLRSIVLDNGFVVRGPLDRFDEVVHRSPPGLGGEVEISLHGRILSERITLR